MEITCISATPKNSALVGSYQNLLLELSILKVIWYHKCLVSFLYEAKS